MESSLSGFNGCFCMEGGSTLTVVVEQLCGVEVVFVLLVLLQSLRQSLHLLTAQDNTVYY